MDYRFTIDVSHLVEKVKSHNLLFYPVMIHIFTSVLNQQRADGEEPLNAAYNLQRDDGTAVILWSESENRFPRFFENYVKKCYRHIVGNEAPDAMPANSVLVSSLPPADKKMLESSVSELYLSAFEVENERTILPVLLKTEEDMALENFAKSCQKMCDMFNEWI
jgi:chloramphenicol O-acetyltransferase